MSTPPLLPEWTDPGPALAMAGINMAMALNLAWAGMLLGGPGVKLLFGLGAHERRGEATLDQDTSVVDPAPTHDAHACYENRRRRLSLAQRVRQFARL